MRSNLSERLSQESKQLSEKVSAAREDLSGKISAVSKEVSSLGQKTSDKLSELDDKILSKRTKYVLASLIYIALGCIASLLVYIAIKISIVKF